MAIIPGSVRIGGFIAPSDSTDQYYVTDPIYGIDGLRSVPDYTTRNAIYNPRRRAGMVVCVQSDNTYWTLKNTSWNGTNSDWAQWLTIPSPTGNTGDVLTTDGTNLSWTQQQGLPTQTGNAGRLLTTDGANLSWITPPTNIPTQTGNAGNILGTNGSVLAWVTPFSLPAQTGCTGYLLSTNGTTPAWISPPISLPTQTGSSGKFLTTNGSTASWATIVIPTVTPGGASTNIQYNSGGTLGGDAGLTWGSNLLSVNGTILIYQGVITSNSQALSTTATWNDPGVVITHWLANITDVNSASGSKLIDLQVGGASQFAINKAGKIIAGSADVSLLTTGTIATGMLGSGTANSGTFLRGDQTWAAPTAGAANQIIFNNAGALTGTNNLAWSGSALGVVGSGTITGSGDICQFTVKSNVTQTYHLQEWQSSAGVVYSYVSATGVFNGDGSGLTNLPAGNLAGTVGTARLGSGTANSGVYLRGDQIWATIPVVPPAGADQQIQYNAGGVIAASSSLIWNYASSTLTATNIAGAGANITGLSAGNITTGSVSTARLGSGTANSSSFLRGDQSWMTISTATLSDFPAQLNNAGKVLTTSGSTLSWATIASANLTDFPTQAGNTGKLLTTNGTALSWSGITSANLTDFPVQTSNAGKVLTTSGSALSWLALATANLSDFPAQTSNTGKLLTTNGSTLSWLTITSVNLSDFPAQSGGVNKFLTTNGTTLSWGSVTITTAAVSDFPAQTSNAGKVLTTSGSVLSWLALASANLSDFPTQTSNANKLLTTNGTVLSWTTLATSNLSDFPAQTGNFGKVLTTSGSTLSWLALASANLSDFPAQTGNNNLFLTTSGSTLSWASPLPSQTGNANKYLTTNGATASWQTPAATVYRASFTSTDLSSNLLTINHNLGYQIVLVQVYDNNNQLVLPAITLNSTTSFTIDCTGLTVSGTWNVIVHS